ncbi:hypothetical protein MTO96_034824 [Rhipicephalus appendiculatus]
MDHHCPWFNNCVCFSTYKFFLLTLFYTVALCVYGLATLTGGHLAGWGSDTWLLKPYGFHVGFLVVVGAVLALALGSFLVMHLSMVSRNETTLERMRSVVFQEPGDSFNLGNRCRNFAEVFGPRKSLWLIPVFTSVGDGVRFPTRLHPARGTVESRAPAVVANYSVATYSTSSGPAVLGPFRARSQPRGLVSICQRCREYTRLPKGLPPSSPSRIATIQHSPGRRGRLANEPVNLCVASAWPLPNGSPRGSPGKQRPQRAHENGVVSPASKTTSTQQSPGRVACQPRSLFGTPTRPLPTTSPSSRKKESGKQRLRQFLTQVLDKPDAALASSPRRQRPQAVHDTADMKTGNSASTSVKGCAFAPTKSQCRQPFTLVQPRDITGHPLSRLPRLVKPHVRTTASNELEQVQALPQSPPASPLSDHHRQRVADLHAEVISSRQGSHLPPPHIQPSVPLAEHKDSGMMPAHLSPADALPLGDCIREPLEVAMDGVDTKVCTPQRSKSSLPRADQEGSDTSLSSGCSYSPLPPPVALDFKTPDFKQFRSPFKGCTIHRNASRAPVVQCDDSSPEFDSPVNATSDVKKLVAFPIP